MANETYGAIKLSDANAVGSMLVKKMGGSGYAPKDWADTINLMGALPERTVSGAMANFSDGADDVPIKNWLMTLPASLDGYTAVNGVRTGKNLFDKTNTSGIVTGHIATSSFNDGNTRAKTVYIEIKGGATYTVSKTAGQRFQIATAEVPPTNGAVYTGRQTGNTASSLTITAGANDKYLWAWIFLEGTDTGTLSDMIDSVQIEVGSSASSYTAYTATTQYIASLGRTIYGGTADVVTGVGTDGYAKDSMTSTYLSGLSSDYIGYESSTAYFGGHPSIWVRNWNYQRAKARQSGGIGCACNYFPVSMHNTTIFSSQYRIYFDVNGKDISSVADFIAFVVALEQNNESLDIVFELATSTDFTFDPITPTPHTALGTNNLWNDRGDSEVTYRRDIDLALNSGASLLGFGLGNPNVGQESEE